MSPPKRSKAKSSNQTAAILRAHFRTRALHDLITTSRVFPITARVDLQQALHTLAGRYGFGRQYGVHTQFGHATTTFSSLAIDKDYAPTIGPIQYEDVDTGELVPVRCLKNALWLCARAERFALLITPANSYGRDHGIHVELALAPGSVSSDLTTRFFDDIEKIVSQGQSFRGKVISLEKRDDYSGRASGVKVHKLRVVEREQVILPDRTLRLLERNVTEFVQQRSRLKALRMGVKKGLLFYGPPGTGKTHTIHFLATQLPEHTTLLITSEQVALLDDYMQLARFLQPAMVVLEDVDLIARARTSMHGPCEESLLNKLLNEMDGLREEAMLLFVLTTNRPQDLESALASRPGRIDQAIEFPLPDDEGRRKLIYLYAGELQIKSEIADALVHKTRGGSAAFIKELMRRSAQFMIADGRSGELQMRHIEGALDEMLFAGGALNVKLLGGSTAERGTQDE